MIERNMILYSACQSQLAYKDIPRGSVELTDGQEKPRGFIILGNTTAVVVFAGSESILDWLTDAKIAHVPWYEFKVHKGFFEEFSKVIPQVVDLLKTYSKGADIIVTGHSLGAALASFVSYELARAHGIPTTCISFESPRWTNFWGARSFNKYVPDSVRIQHHNDLVCRVPKIGYYHVSRLVRIGDDGRIIKFSGILGAFEHFIEVEKADLNLSAITDHKIENVMPAIERFAEKGGAV